MKRLKVAKNQGSGCKWHIMKKENGKWKSLCGKISKKPEKDFQGLKNKPPHGTWCGKGEEIFKSTSFKAYRTKGKLNP